MLSPCFVPNVSCSGLQVLSGLLLLLRVTPNVSWGPDSSAFLLVAPQGPAQGKRSPEQVRASSILGTDAGAGAMVNSRCPCRCRGLQSLPEMLPTSQSGAVSTAAPAWQYQLVKAGRVHCCSGARAAHASHARPTSCCSGEG